MTNETETAAANRRTTARRVAFGADRALSTAFGDIEALVRLSPQDESELRQMTYDIARMQRRMQEIVENVQ